MAELGISGGRCKVYSGRKFPGNLDRLREIFSDEDTFLLYPGKDSSPLEDIVVERTEEGHRLRDGIQCSRQFHGIDLKFHDKNVCEGKSQIDTESVNSQ